MVEVKKTTIWLRKKDAEKPIDGIIKNQGVIMIENKIILIEDDKEIRGMINDYLSGEFEVTAFNDGMSAIQKITSYDEYALALIDLMLPDISGMEIIKIIRKVSKIPIIIITAKDNDIDKSLGLNLGADDYVVKPFSLIELTARIKANIIDGRRIRGKRETGEKAQEGTDRGGEAQTGGTEKEDEEPRGGYLHSPWHIHPYAPAHIRCGTGQRGRGNHHR